MRKNKALSLLLALILLMSLTPSAAFATDDTPKGLPGAPTNVIVEPGDKELDISWTAPNDGGSELAGWEISVSDGEDSWLYYNLPQSTAVIWKNLKNGTAYTVKIRAVNELGAGDTSKPVIGTPCTIPSAPVALRVTPGDKQLLIEWDTPYDGGSPITKYEVSVSENGQDSWVDISESGATTVSYLAQSLLNGTAYTVKIRAVNSAVNSARKGAEASLAATPSATVITPSAPRNLVAEAADKKVTLSWQPPENNGGAAIDKYEVSKDGGTSWSDAASSTSHTFTDLTNGTIYDFSVCAVNSASLSSDPVTVQATPVASLSFTYDSAFDIPASIVGGAITAIDVSSGAAGGTTPYTFSASDLPAGITISAAGVLSGTPTAAQGAGTATITVTDAVKSTDAITISYGAVSDPPHSLQSFKNDKTGVIVKVHAAADAKLIVTEGILHSEGTCVACDTIRKSPNTIALYDISIEGDFSGTIEVSIPVPASYKGKTVIVRHCQGPDIEEVELTVKNGYATGTFLSLSPFALFSINSPIPVSPTNPVNPAAMPHTGDSSVLPLCLGIVVAMLVAIGCTRVRQSKRRTE